MGIQLTSFTQAALHVSKIGNISHTGTIVGVDIRPAFVMMIFISFAQDATLARSSLGGSFPANHMALERFSSRESSMPCIYFQLAQEEKIKLEKPYVLP